jgi:hypothetical protein
MRRALLSLVMLVAGCARPDPLADLHARSQAEARAMIGKEYIFVAPARVCRDQSGVYEGGLYANRVLGTGCRTVGAGRFRIEDVVALPNDGRTLLRITGPEVAGYMPYETYMPQPYKSVADYFPTGK